MRCSLAVWLLAVVACVAGVAAHAATVERALPRTVIALYENREGGVQNSYIHRLAEMPLNHLGLTVEYHDIHAPLPDLEQRADVAGVLTWFFSDTRVKDPEAYVQWALEAMKLGKKYVVMGPTGIHALGKEAFSPLAAKSFLRALGVEMEDGWVEDGSGITYDFTTPGMFYGANPFAWVQPAYQRVRAVDPAVRVHLKAMGGSPEFESHLVITGPAGGYAAPNYLFKANERHGEEVSQWFLNPYEFFRLAFAADNLPKPDTTTIAGRRIYYSHIDGDGWNNVTQLEEYRQKPTLSAQVIMDKAVKAYPDLPVTLTLIAAEIDPEWVAVADSRAVAKEFLALPQVEAGSHSYSHPFHWQFFMGKPEKEIPFLPRYGRKTWKPKTQPATAQRPPELPLGYSLPRAYASEIFDIHKEVEGSLKAIGELLPKGKKVMLFTWSGNCSPWEQAVRLTREAGVQNINGGDSRFDTEYPGGASLAPIGRPVGKERQIYASTSNENTYTDLWSDHFHAYQYLVQTLKNSESPARLKPFNVYYHIYGGEKEASLSALLANLEYARTQELAPISASDYTRIAEGFYEARLIALGPDVWRIERRGALQTIRFDRRTLQSVDFERSRGVIGQRHVQGSLYVYLDAAMARPVIALKDNPGYEAFTEEKTPYLVESRWLVTDVKKADGRIVFQAQGYGRGEMTWEMPSPGRYRVSVNGGKEDVVVTSGRSLRLDINQNAIKPLRVTIAPAGQGGGRA